MITSDKCSTAVSGRWKRDWSGKVRNGGLKSSVADPQAVIQSTPAMVSQSCEKSYTSSDNPTSAPPNTPPRKRDGAIRNPTIR